MRKKICFILLIMIIILSILAIQVNANSFTTTLTPDSSGVYESGSEVIITVSVSDLDVGDSGINAFSAYLSYDTDVFETLESDSVEGLNSWSSTYSTSSGQIALTKNSFVNDDEEIMQITLITKSDLDDGTTGTVSLSNIQASNSEDDIDSTTATATIEIGTKTTISVSTNTTNSTNTTDTNTSTNSVSITANTTNTTNTTNSTTINTTTNSSTYNTITNTSDSSDSSDIPYTGTFSYALIKIIIGIALIGVVLFVKIKKMEDIK